MKRVVLLLAALAMFGVEATPYGICAHVTWGEFAGRNRTFAMASAAGIGIVRCDFNWEDMQRGAGIDFSKTDAAVADAARYGIQILPIVSYGHRRLCPKPHQDPEPWGKFVRAVASRYARDCPCFEIWNEQNNGSFWKGKPAATNYLVVLRKAFEVIRSVAPNAKVVIGGFAGVPYGYIEELYKAGGGRYFDVMNVHPYTVPICPEERLDVMLSKLRGLMAKCGDEKKPIWLTEIGWPTCERKPTDGSKKLAWDEEGGVGEQVQAEFTARAMAISFAKGVRKVFPYQFRSDEDRRYSREAGFGLVHSDFVPKPAWIAYANFISLCPPGSAPLGERWSVDAKTCLLVWSRPKDADAWRKGKRRGEWAGMVWKYNGTCHRLLCFASDNVRFYDLFGKELRIDKVEQGYPIEVSGSPVFFVGDKCLGFADGEVRKY